MSHRYYYLADYSGACRDLNASPAGNTKMKYIIRCFETMGLYLHVFSSAETKTKRFCRPKAENYEHYQVKYVTSFLTGIHVLNRLAKAYNRRQVLSFLRHRKQDDVVIIYHNTPYLRLINKLQASRKFKLVYEVEEIYSLVRDSMEETVRFEIETVSKADGFICVTKQLNDVVNPSGKPYAVACGSYMTYPKLADRFDDSLIHCVYAGTLDPRKGGAAAAVAARYLDNRFRMHILGFGNEEQLRYLQETIKESTSQNGCVVTYDGCLSGDDYLSFLQKCHIGLSPQNPDASFNGTSFPSKIMVYLANGLNVVSIYTDAIASFDDSDVMDFYHHDDPQELAAAIVRSAEHLQDQRAVVEKLDALFVRDLRALLTDISND